MRSFAALREEERHFVPTLYIMWHSSGVNETQVNNVLRKDTVVEKELEKFGRIALDNNRM
jgi:hypothetical protein